MEELVNRYGVIPILGSGRGIVMVKRKNKLFGFPKGQVDYIGGFREAPLVCAIREAYEELGGGVIPTIPLQYNERVDFQITPLSYPQSFRFNKSNDIKKPVELFLGKLDYTDPDIPVRYEFEEKLNGKFAEVRIFTSKEELNLVKPEQRFVLEQTLDMMKDEAFFSLITGK